MSTIPLRCPLESESDLPATPDVDAPHNDMADCQWISTDSLLSHSVRRRPIFASPSGVVRPQDLHLVLVGPMSPVGLQEGDVFGADFYRDAPPSSRCIARPGYHQLSLSAPAASMHCCLCVVERPVSAYASITGWRGTRQAGFPFAARGARDRGQRDSAGSSTASASGYRSSTASSGCATCSFARC